MTTQDMTLQWRSVGYQRLRADWPHATTGAYFLVYREGDEWVAFMPCDEGSECGAEMYRGSLDDILEMCQEDVNLLYRERLMVAAGLDSTDYSIRPEEEGWQF